MAEAVKAADGPATVPAPPNGDIILKARHITKVFPGTLALDKVDFNVYRGKVNVLVGENGAGKSTLMKILAGVQQATEGQLLLDGQEIHIKSITDAERHGIGIIHQELNLFPNLSVTENIFMAREIKKNGIVIDQATQKEHTRELIERLQQPIEPDDLVGDLRIGHQQIVEIARAIAQEVRILIMDEPTSALSSAEVKVLFEVINDLKKNGVAIVYLSHKLDELLQIGDYVTVLRDGRLRAERPAAEINVAWIIEEMVGKSSALLFQGKAGRLRGGAAGRGFDPAPAGRRLHPGSRLVFFAAGRNSGYLRPDGGRALGIAGDIERAEARNHWQGVAGRSAHQTEQRHRAD
jgi:erythritol transport system ATP-binding protein